MTSMESNLTVPRINFGKIGRIAEVPSSSESKAIYADRLQIRELLERQHRTLLEALDALGLPTETHPEPPSTHGCKLTEFMNGAEPIASKPKAVAWNEEGNGIQEYEPHKHLEQPALMNLDIGFATREHTAEPTLDLSPRTEQSINGEHGNGESSERQMSVGTDSSPVSPSRTSQAARSRQSIRGKAQVQSRGCLKKLVMSSKFELCFAVLIGLNTFTMCLEAQYNGFDTGYHIKHPTVSGPAVEVWPAADLLFKIMEYAFGLLFTVEVLIKFVALKVDFVKSGWNLFDSLIILFWILDTLARLRLLVNPMFLRLGRLARLLRLLRFVKAFQVFDVLHLMIGSIKACSSVLLWSTAVLGLIMTTCALVFNLGMDTYIKSLRGRSDADDLLAAEIFEYFGTYSRSMLSMFEISLGNATPICRLLHEGVSEWFGPVVMFYRITVNFALLKVINGIFMHETFRVAASDDDLMIMQKNRKTELHIKKMTQLFVEADESGDGLLDCDEFNEILSDARVKTWLSAQEIEIRDVELVFNLVDVTGRGVISAEDLVRGFSQLKGAAKSLDMVTLLHENKHIRSQIDGIEQKLATILSSAKSG
eukprot:TRINITY_DN10905_c0_g5_i1.p1 TRINITY_DN10905_c0_g5~~TRINITY_DN10905_c0_g5_i1.p1  ORF type:complete len:594 (-),score=113.17 TRINITY_DN10905_c0_g5_i1:236-2017(-)